MEALFCDLAEREPTWETSINPYEVVGHSGKIIDRFCKNWVAIFGSGYGLPSQVKNVLSLRYMDCKSVDDIAKEIGVSKKVVNDIIEYHIRNIQSHRALILLACDYPLQLSVMKQHRFEGYFDNYGRWHEPEFNINNTDVSISAFDIFMNKYFNNIAKDNSITTIQDLIDWLNSSVDAIRNHKAGIGKTMAKLLLNNEYVLKCCDTEVIEVLDEL